MSSDPPQRRADEEFIRRKNDLELRSLEVGIEERTRPLWKRLSFYATISPAVAALVALVVGLNNGWFDTQRRELEAKKARLEIDVIALDSKKTEIEIRVNTLRKLVSSLTGDIQTLTRERDAYLADKKSLEVAVTGLTKERDTYRNEKGTLESQLKAGDEAIKSRDTQLKLLEAMLPKTDAQQSASLKIQRDTLTQELNDLETLRAEVANLTKELSISRKLEWLRRGIYGSSNTTSAPRLGTNSSAKEFKLNVDLKQ
jgi:hypothetical protein